MTPLEGLPDKFDRMNRIDRIKRRPNIQRRYNCATILDDQSPVRVELSK